MDKQRELAIFRNFVKLQMKDKGIKINNMKEELEKLSNQLNALDPSLGVTTSELFLLTKELTEELVATAFNSSAIEETVQVGKYQQQGSRSGNY